MAVLELPLEDGEHIGPYRIVRLLGRGGMGEVFLARDDDLNRWVAIKRIRHDTKLGPTLHQRLLREAQAVVNLDHPAIVRVLHLQKCGSDDCIVMEYVQGETLAGTLRDGPLELAFALRLAKEVAHGLAAAHAAGIIHRDLKAENVMITPPPAAKAKILDFGLAKPIGMTADDPSLTETGHVVGTRRCMSPEQLRGGEVDARSDLFSLGVLLYEMLTGSSPIQGANAQAILCKMFRSGAPPRLVALLERLLAQDPAARFQSAAEVIRELEAIAGSQSPSGGPELEETVSDLPTQEFRQEGNRPPSVAPFTAAPTPWPEESPRPRRRHFLRVWGVLSLSVLIAGAITFLLSKYWPPDPLPAAPVHTKLLWIVVPKPQGPGHDARFQDAASALARASLRTLGFLHRIVPIGSVVGSSKYQSGMAGTATEDILTSTLEPSGHRGVIMLSRIRHGKVWWETSFTASIDQKDLPGLEKEVEHRLPGAFHLHPPRTDVSREDFATFFAIKQRIEEGHDASEAELSALEKIVARSPYFLEAQLMEADVMIAVDPRQGGRARELVGKARARAPGDPRPLQSAIKISLAERRWNDAAIALPELKRLEPNNPQIPALQANLELGQGRLAEARSAWKKAVEYVPSWRNLLSLANVEAQLGLAEDARSHLMDILAEWKGNIYALRRLAELELDYGDPAKAETIYLDLIKGSPTCIDYGNLGTARVLLHRYSDAVRSFQEALKIEPENAAATLNLADAELALGHQEPAKALYKKVLSETDHPPVGATAADDMIKAQCLSHLGRQKEATEIVREALGRNPDDPEVLRSAALVFTLAGDYGSAVEKIREAIDKHVGPNWFKGPYYSPLFDDPTFKRLVRRVSAPGGPVGAAPSSSY